ncbi:MAG: hypothetical protein JOZ52_03790, partial [Acidobacteria bacterium]|nr:hypothetical protein [Acidobacteriota bacterium]
GTKAEETYTDAKGAIRLKTVYQYDGSKRLIGKVFFGAKGEPTGEASVRYKDGKISEVINYDTKGGTTGRHVYVYKDNTVELLNYTLSGLAGRQLMTFDEQGRLTELLGYQTDISSDMRWVYHYDGKGDIVEEVVYAGGVPFKWSYEYEYDAQGNWLTQFITPVPDKPGKEKPKPVDVTRRIIGYGTASQPKTPASLSVARSVLNEETNSVLKGLISSRDISRLLDELFYTPSGGSPIPKGSLSASVIINESGKVIAAVAGEPGTFVMRVSGKNIKDAVILSVKSWRFDPTVRGGVPQSMTKLVDISFN